MKYVLIGGGIFVAAFYLFAWAACRAAALADRQIAAEHARYRASLRVVPPTHPTDYHL